MKTTLFSFERLQVWQKARMFTKDVYELTKKFPQSELFALTQQLRRAVVSVPSNLAEGSSRRSVVEHVRFVEIAYGSLLEVYCQLQLACDFGYLAETELAALKPRIREIAAAMTGLRKSLLVSSRNSATERFDL